MDTKDKLMVTTNEHEFTRILGHGFASLICENGFDFAHHGVCDENAAEKTQAADSDQREVGIKKEKVRGSEASDRFCWFPDSLILLRRTRIDGAPEGESTARAP